MSEWPRRFLGDLIHVKHGFAFKGEHFASVGDKLVLKPGNFPIGGGIRLRPGKDDYYTGTFPPEFELAPGDLLVVMTDLTQAAPILGSPAFVPAEPVMLHNQRLGLVTIKPDVELDKHFLYYLLLSDTSRSQIRATATGATVRHTAPERIYKVRVAVPELKVQERVGEVLWSLDALIENNRRRVEVLEDMAREIYREWFVHFRFPGHENTSFIESDRGRIPDGWAWGTFGDLVSIGKDTVNPAEIDPTTPAVGLEHIPRRQLTLTDWGSAAMQGSRKAQFLKGDILFGKIRPYFHKVSLAPLDGICSTDAIVMRPKSIYWGQAVTVASSDEFVANAVQTSNGTKMPRADWKVISTWRVPIPPDPISQSFTGVVSDHLGLAEKLMFEGRELAVMRDLLLPKLVTGQIDVSRLDLDALVEGAVA